MQYFCRFSPSSVVLGYWVLRFFLSATTVSTVAVVAGDTVSLSLYFSWYQVICFSLVMFRQLASAVEFVVSLVAQVVLSQLSACSRFRLATGYICFAMSLPLVQCSRLFYISHRLVFISWRVCPCNLAYTVAVTQRLAPPR